MKYHALFVIFEKKTGNIFKCSLLQIIGGALRVKVTFNNVSVIFQWSINPITLALDMLLMYQSLWLGRLVTTLLGGEPEGRYIIVSFPKCLVS